MKKVFKIFVVLLSFTLSLCGFVSCVDDVYTGSPNWALGKYNTTPGSERTLDLSDKKSFKYSELGDLSFPFFKWTKVSEEENAKSIKVDVFSKDSSTVIYCKQENPASEGSTKYYKLVKGKYDDGLDKYTFFEADDYLFKSNKIEFELNKIGGNLGL